NSSSMKQFILLGLSENRGVQKIYFVVFLLFYTLTVAGNLIVLTVTSSQHLNSSMYIFLCHLSFVDVCYSSDTAPQMISGFLVENKTLSFAGCIGQLFGLQFFGCTEVFILTATAYDRCVAVCWPLHYPALTSRRLCGRMVGVSWAGGFLHSTLQTLPAALLPFCGPNKVAHYFCDVHPLLPLVCADIRAEGLAAVANSGVTSLSCFLILVTSYGVILISLRGQTLARWHKVQSMCRSHITAVILCLGPSTFVYIHKNGGLSEDRSVAMFYTLITPTLNPLIYTLQDGEVKGAMRKPCRR
ncbi:OR4S1 protein, partial [Ploceus nigricollis]|nr:OR4S1 protein [Ploceus nigricollis]